jgi:RNA polymerase-binding transcription factor DksA
MRPEKLPKRENASCRKKRYREGENVETKRTMRELDAVLERIESGKFGICEKCGRSIEEERLSANPTVTLCPACAAKVG